MPITVNIASASPIKIEAVKQALTAQFPGVDFVFSECPVELQERDDIHAQPIGFDETVRYAEYRLAEMIRRYGSADLNITIESGAIGGCDCAMLAIQTRSGRRLYAQSSYVAFPKVPYEGRRVSALEVALRRGRHKTTAGDIIHEAFPDIPANDWQALTHSVIRDGVEVPCNRRLQIVIAFERVADKLTNLLNTSLEEKPIASRKPRSTAPPNITLRVQTSGPRRGEIMTLSANTKSGAFLLPHGHGPLLSFAPPSPDELRAPWVYVKDILDTPAGTAAKDLVALRAVLSDLSPNPYGTGAWRLMVDTPDGSTNLNYEAATKLHDQFLRTTPVSQRGEHAIRVAQLLCDLPGFLDRAQAPLLQIPTGSRAKQPFAAYLEDLIRSTLTDYPTADADIRTYAEWMRSPEMRQEAMQELLFGIAMVLDRTQQARALRNQVRPDLMQEMTKRFSVSAIDRMALATASRVKQQGKSPELIRLLQIPDGPSGGPIVDFLIELFPSTRDQAHFLQTLDQLRFGEGTVTSADYLAEFRKTLGSVDPQLVSPTFAPIRGLTPV